jgi:Zn-dependent protease
MNEQERLQQNLREVAAHLQGGGTEPRPEENRPAAEQNKSHRFARLGSLGVVLVFMAGKFKFVLMGLKLMKFSSILTMLVSIWAYSTIWGWPFAAGFVLLIVIHELGHGIVMRMMGIPAGAPTFIPFVGAVIAMKGRPRNAYVEAMVAFGGPVLGSAAALVCLILAWSFNSDFWMSLAFSGFMINLFNLLPISPLDGGRIVGAFSRKMWAVGFLIGVPAFLASKSPLLFLILIIGVLGLLGRRHEPAGYFDIPPAVKRKIAVAYFVLAAVLASAASLSHVPTA